MLGVDSKLMTQSLHSCRTLEAELVDAFNSGRVSNGEYQAKIERLRIVKNQISIVLQLTNQFHHIEDAGSRIIELPILSDTSHAEQKIIYTTLVESGKVLRTISDDSNQLLRKIYEIQSGRIGWIGLIVHLSWQRARIHWVEKKLALVRSIRRSIEAFVKHLTRVTKDSGAKGDLVDTFRDFETTTARIASLKAKLHREVAINRDQEKWLKQYEDKRLKKQQIESPPVPAKFLEVQTEIASNVIAIGDVAIERLVIARKLSKSLSQDFEMPEIDSSLKSSAFVVQKHIPIKNSKKHRIEKKRRSAQ